MPPYLHCSIEAVFRITLNEACKLPKVRAMVSLMDISLITKITKVDKYICFHEQEPCALILSYARTAVPEHGVRKAVDRVDSRGGTNFQLRFLKHIGRALNVQRNPDLIVCR